MPLGTGLFPEILSTSKSLWYNLLSFGVPHAAAHGADQYVVNKLRVSERASTSCGWFDYTYPGAVVCIYQVQECAESLNEVYEAVVLLYLLLFRRARAARRL